MIVIVLNDVVRPQVHDPVHHVVKLVLLDAIAVVNSSRKIAVPGYGVKVSFCPGRLLLGRPFDEATLLRLGAAFERATPHHRLTPRLAGASAS